MPTKAILDKEIKSLRRRLKKISISYMKFADGSGLSYKWVTDFRDDKIPNPRYKSLVKLDEALVRHG